MWAGRRGAARSIGRILCRPARPDQRDGRATRRDRGANAQSRDEGRRRAAPANREHGMTATRRFDGKVALVTGGNSGIGRTVAERLVGEGARVVVVGRNRETVAQTAAALGGAAQGVVADTSRLDDLDRVIAATREFGGGRLDVVFANAGIGTF